MQDRYILMLLIVLGLNFPVHHYFTEYYTKVPLDTKVQLDSAKEVSKLIEIRMPQAYDINLVFNKKHQDYNTLIDIIREISSQSNTGTKVPITWSLTEQKTNKTIYKEQKFSAGRIGYSREEISLSFGQFQIPSGIYTLKITVNEDIPILTNISTSLKINYKSKNGTTWHNNYMWLGAMFNYFLSPILIISLCILLVRSNLWRLKIFKK